MGPTKLFAFALFSFQRTGPTSVWLATADQISCFRQGTHLGFSHEAHSSTAQGPRQADAWDTIMSRWDTSHLHPYNGKPAPEVAPHARLLR